MERHGKVLIIGGGIGGLTLGVALSRVGIECEIFERDHELRTVGSGLLLQSAPMRALQTLGLDKAVLLAGRELEAATVRSAGGHTLQHNELTFLRSEFGQPTVAIHRAVLHELLLARLGEVGQLTGAISTRLRNVALRMIPLKRQLRDMARSGIASLPASLGGQIDDRGAHWASAGPAAEALAVSWTATQPTA